MSYALLAEDVLANCPGADLGFALRALRRTGIEFAVKTLLWEEDIDQNIVADQAEYTLTPAPVDVGTISTPRDVVVHEIVQVKVKTDSTQEFDRIGAMSSACYRLIGDDTLKFEDGYEPATAVTAGLRVRAVLRPERGSDELPAFWFDRYGDTLVAGATAGLMSTPGRPYTDLGNWRHWQELYNRGVVRAGVEKRKLGRPELEGFSA